MKNYLVNFIYFIVFPLVLTSCKKNSDDQITTDRTEVIFTVGGAEDGVELKASKANLNLVQLESEMSAPTSTTKLINGFEFETYESQDTMESFLNNSSRISSGSVNPNIQTKLASTSPMEPEKKFRILMRKSSGGPWIANVIVKVGSELSVQVELNEEYEYIAYSYNDEQDIPNPLLSGEGLTLQTPKDRDLLWAKKTIKITNSGTTREAIHFYHKVALVSLNLDMSLFAGMVDAINTELIDITYNAANSSKNGKFYTSTLNLETGELSNHVAYTPPSEIFTVVDPAYPAKRNNFFYTSNVEGLESFKIKLNQFVVSSVNQLTEPFLVFNYNFTPSAGRPPVKEGHRLTATLLLMKTLHQMYVLSGDSIGNRSAAQSWHLATTSTGAGGIQGYEGRVQDITGRTPDAGWYNRANYTGASGYMRTNFAKSAPANSNQTDINKLYYTAGKIKMLDDVISDAGQTHHALYGNTFTIGQRLLGPRPDLVVICFYSLVLNDNDNDRLIDYVKNGGTVIVLVDRGFPRGPRGYIDNHKTINRFLRSIFGTGPDDISIQMNNVLAPSSASQSNYLFKMKSSANNPGVNGFYGNLSSSYWASKGDLVSVSGMDPSKYISLSDNTPINPTGGGVPTVNGEVMFKHKTYNVFWIGDSDFLINTGYSVSTSTANNSANWRFPLTSTVFGAQYPVDNAKIFGNMVVWSFVQEAIKRQ